MHILDKHLGAMAEANRLTHIKFNAHGPYEPDSDEHTYWLEQYDWAMSYCRFEIARIELGLEIADHGGWEEFHQKQHNYTMYDYHKSQRLKFEKEYKVWAYWCGPLNTDKLGSRWTTS